MSDGKMPEKPNKAQPVAAAPVPAAVVPVAPVASMPKPRVMIHESNIKTAEYARSIWCAVAPAAHSLEDAAQPYYLWRKHAQIRVGDEIEIRHELMAYIIKGVVVRVDKDAQSIDYKPFPGFPLDLTAVPAVVGDFSGAVIEELGSNKWCVRLGSQIMKAGFDTASLANDWLNTRQAKARQAAKAA